MNKENLHFILSQGENYLVEFKEKFDKTFSKEIVAFANASGGRIFLGVSDTGEVKGIESTNKLKSQIQDVARNCDPPVAIRLTEFENILEVDVPDSNNKPHSCSNGFFRRIGANSQKMSRDEIFQAGLKSGKLRFDEQICEKFYINKDLDHEKLEEYLKLCQLSTNTDTEDVLVNLGVVQRDDDGTNMTNAGVLFFAKEPQFFISGSGVTCLDYQTNEKVNILDRKIYNEGVIENINNAVNYVKKHIDTRFEIDSLKRKEIMQFPEDTFREAIVNAVIHCDYSNPSGETMVEVFRNKLIISNIGGLVEWLPKEDFGRYSRPRNNLMTNLLS